MKAFKNALEKKLIDLPHEIEKVNITIEEQSEYILNKLTDKLQLSFLDLVMEIKSKLRLIVTFIALLEMVKENQIGLESSAEFNDFSIIRL
jgi:segregation and condensation protein A